MYCPKCGTYNEDAYRFCLSCGTRLEVHPLETLDRKTSDGRYIIDPKDWNVPSVVEEPVVAVPIQCEIDRQIEDADKSFEQPDASAVEVLSEIEPAEDGHRRDNPVEDDVIVLRKAEPRMSASIAKRISSSEEAAQQFPRGFRIFLACCAVLGLWIFLTAVVIPGLNLKKQGAIIQVAVMGAALAVIKVSWRSIVGDSSKADKKEF